MSPLLIGKASLKSMEAAKELIQKVIGIFPMLYNWLISLFVKDRDLIFKDREIQYLRSSIERKDSEIADLKGVVENFNNGVKEIEQRISGKADLVSIEVGMILVRIQSQIRDFELGSEKISRIIKWVDYNKEKWTTSINISDYRDVSNSNIDSFQQDILSLLNILCKNMRSRSFGVPRLLGFEPSLQMPFSYIKALREIRERSLRELNETNYLDSQQIKELDRYFDRLIEDIDF